MKKSPQKQISMNDLPSMVARGFSSMEEKMATKQQLFVLKEDMDNQFTAVNLRLTKVEDKLDEMREILARFEEGDILDLQNRVKILERIVKAMSKRLE